MALWTRTWRQRSASTAGSSTSISFCPCWRGHGWKSPTSPFTSFLKQTREYNPCLEASVRCSTNPPGLFSLAFGGVATNHNQLALALVLTCGVSDSYVFWDNAFRFLQTFDPDQPIYMGSPSPGRFDSKRNIKTWFANGGPGYVLSRAAIKALLHRETSPHGQYIDPPLTEKWLPLLRGECCGDSVVGWTLWNASIALQGYWPMFNPHPLHGIPYSDRYWCQPVLTLHKTSPKDMVDVWRWEFGQRQHSVRVTFEV